MLQRQWKLPLRKLVVAMPITAVIVGVLAHALVGLSWTESLLLGALLSPTDPVLSSGVVTDPRVPELIRHSLNLESGLNDGLRAPGCARAGGSARTGRQRLRVVAVRAGGHRPRPRVRPGVRRSWLAADAARGRGRQPADTGTSACALRPRPGVRNLRADRPGQARERVHRGVRGGDRRRHPAPGPAHGLRRGRRRGRGDRQARDLHRVREPADARRTLHRRLGGGRGRGGHLPARAAGRDLGRTGGNRNEPSRQGLHGVVRPEGGGDDDLLPADPRAPDRRRAGDLQPRRAGRVRLDPAPRAQRHPRDRMDRQALAAFPG